MPLSLQDSYARSMACHGYGHGFYEPESADDVRPGYCGYIDESGRWQTILDLSKKEEMIQAGFDEPPIAYNMPTTKRRWGPKTSSAVVGKKTHIEAGASALPAGVPLDASVLWTYSHASDFGAVLLCSDDVVNEGIRQKSPYSRWALKNAKAISKAFPDVKAHGFFIVTSTWSTSAVSTTAWSNPSKQIEVGVKLGVAGVGDVGPSFEYYRAHTSGSWIDADVSAYPSPGHMRWANAMGRCDGQIRCLA